jgi:hypothetical protein
MDEKEIRETYSSLSDDRILFLYHNEFNQLTETAKNALLDEIQERGLNKIEAKQAPPETNSEEEDIYAIGSQHPFRLFVWFAALWGLFQIYLTWVFYSDKQPILWQIIVDIVAILMIISALLVLKLKSWGYSLVIITLSIFITMHALLSIPPIFKKISEMFFGGKADIIGFPPIISAVAWSFWLLYFLSPKARHLFFRE